MDVIWSLSPLKAKHQNNFVSQKELYQGEETKLPPKGVQLCQHNLFFGFFKSSEMLLISKIIFVSHSGEKHEHQSKLKIEDIQIM